MKSKNLKFWQGKIRNRVCGLYVKNGALLMVKIKMPAKKKEFWMPPGGAVYFGESLTDCLKREFYEETNIQIVPTTLKYISEVQRKGIHAIEFYFFCRALAGKPELGHDPEYHEEEQVLTDLQYIEIKDLANIDVIPAFLSQKFEKDWKSNSTEIEYIPVS